MHYFKIGMMEYICEVLITITTTISRQNIKVHGPFVLVCFLSFPHTLYFAMQDM